MVRTRSAQAESDKAVAVSSLYRTYAFVACLGLAFVLCLRYAADQGKLQLTVGTLPPPPAWLLAFRTFAFGTIVTTSLYIMADAPFKMDGTTRYGALVKNVQIGGKSRFCTMTVWAWNLQGAFFGTNLLLAASPFLKLNIPSWLPSFAQVAFEISAPLSMLITTVVTHVLYPMAIKRGSDPAFLFKTAALLMHNANLIFMLVEMLSGPFQLHAWHTPIAALFGLVYVVFANLNERFGTGIFFYPFLCPSSKNAIAAHVALVTALCVCALCVSALQHLYLHVHSIAGGIAAFSITSQLVMFRRPDARK